MELMSQAVHCLKAMIETRREDCQGKESGQQAVGSGQLKAKAQTLYLAPVLRCLLPTLSL